MLDIQHISKTFNPGTVNEKRAITDLSLHLETGEFVTVIGSNGAGKSTLFNAIGGSFYVDAGSIVLGGTDLTFLPEYERSRRIGRLFQDPLRGTAPHMTIEENLALAYLRSAHGNPFKRLSQKDRDVFREQLRQLDMGLEDRMHQPVGLLSGGQRQALTLLMATMVPPQLLLLDEHTAALDPGTAEKVLTLTKRIVAEGNITCLMVTHNMSQALELGTRTLMMATMVPPQLLLLDEHTAALDPGTAEKVLTLTKRIVAEGNITCLMVTHNMSQALELGTRTLMMADGGIVLDVSGPERAGMTVEDLIARFRAGTGHALDNDRMLLS